MPNVQPNYSENIRASIPGAKGTMTPATVISRSVENVGGVAFGKAVAQGSTNDNTCHAFTAGDTVVLGVALLDRSARGADGNSYGRYESVRVLTEGDVWVTVAQSVVAGDPVFVRPSNGDFQKDNTNSAVQWSGARFDTSAAATGIALIRRD